MVGQHFYISPVCSLAALRTTILLLGIFALPNPRECFDCQTLDVIGR